MKITVVIADDEAIARDGLRAMLQDVDWLKVVGEAASGRAAVELIDTLKPDLVLLDIEMPGLRGTDVLRQSAHQPYAIFTTAYSQHAVTAFELGALDYLLKPFGAARLSQALERVRAAIGEPAAAFDRLAESLRKGPMTRLFVRTGSGVVPVPVAQVAWFEARGDYVAAHTASGRHLLHLSLNRLEERLDPKVFVRVHRTHIVNLEHVRAFRRAEPGRMEAELKDGTRLAVSRAKAQELRAVAR